MAATHYPEFDVLEQQEAWDGYSRAVVTARLQPKPPSVLSDEEVATLVAVAANLLYESRQPLLDFVISYVDQQLDTEIGESQRKPGVPHAVDLVRQGLKLLDAVASAFSQTPFRECEPDLQARLLAMLQKGQLQPPSEFQAFPQKDFFKKLLGLATDALASHPTIWSEMGYPGPAYPRGYYRIERGLRDPWEAQRAAVGDAQSAQSPAKGRD